MGIETHVFAWEEGAVAKDTADFFYPVSIIEKEIILEKAKEIKPDGIISIASDLAMLTVNYIADKLGLAGNSPECTEITTNKYKMRRAFLKAGILCPKFCSVKKEIEADLTKFKFPVIVKPTDRSGSRGVTKVDCIRDIQEAVDNAMSYSLAKEVIIEEYIVGDELSIETISFKGNHYFLASTDKETSGAPHFVETAHHQPSIFNKTKRKLLEDTTVRTLDALSIKNGASHTELKITPEGEIYIIETGARMGGDFIGSHLVELSSGYDFLKGVIEVSLGRFSNPVLSENDYSGVYYIVPDKCGKISKIINNCSKYGEIVKSEVNISENETIDTVKQSNDRKAYYIYQSNKKFKNSKVIEFIVSEHENTF
ncbi:MAG: hypothetical protein CSB55_08580 [Candidatus Cloacimonadota bacterium]|nr:MAG: hypothetical protein CSB55_08580 [Candidatus Cloacimonadota bacterium]